MPGIATAHAILRASDVSRVWRMNESFGNGLTDSASADMLVEMKSRSMAASILAYVARCVSVACRGAWFQLLGGR